MERLVNLTSTEIAVTFLVAFLLIGCDPDDIDDDRFVEVYASVYCRRLSQCYYAAYESEYDADREECRDEVEELVEYVDSSQCNFDEDEALDCLDDWREDDCEDLFYEGNVSEACALICSG